MSAPPRAAYPDPIPDVLPFAGISLLAGAPGIGKTALLASVLRAFRDQTPIFGHQPSPLTSIAMLSADRAWASTHQWFARAGYPEIAYYSLVDDDKLDKSKLKRKFDRIRLFAEFVSKLPLQPGGLLAVDPISLFLGGNLLDYDACMVACMEIRQILRERSISCIGLAHSGKQRADASARYLRPQDRILGSAALFGFTDTQMYLESPQEGDTPHYTFLWCPHLAPVETFELTRDHQGLFIPWNAPEGGNAARVASLIPIDTPIRYAELRDAAAEIPISPATVKRCLKQLLEDGQIQKTEIGYRRVRPA